MAQPFRIVVGNEVARQRAIDILIALNLDKCPWAVSITTYKRNRSLEQNNLLWMWYGIIAQETGHDAEDIHEFCKRKFLPPVFIDVNGEVQEVRRTTTKLKVDDMTDYLNKVHSWAVTELGVILPLPEERVA